MHFARLHIDAGDAQRAGLKFACFCERWLLPSATGCTSSWDPHHAPKCQTVRTVARLGQGHETETLYDPRIILVSEESRLI